jgi:BON domain
MKRSPLIICLLACSLSLFASSLTKSHSEGKFSDAEIEATIKAKLAKSKIGQEGFQVHVKDRVATWTGTTSVMQHKGAATRMAKTAGALQVTNNIKVSGDAAAKAKGNLGGQPRHVQVKAAAPAKGSGQPSTTSP